MTHDCSSRQNRSSAVKSRTAGTARETHKNVNRRPHVLISAERAEAPVPPLCGDNSATVEPADRVVPGSCPRPQPRDLARSAATLWLSHADRRQSIVGLMRGNYRPKRAGGN